MSNDNETSWVAPLARTLLGSKPLEDTHGPMTCPICDCDHQVFQGMGVFSPDKEGTHLICAFPSTETLVKIDLPQDIKVGGLVSYTRYACTCNGHRWAILTAYLQDSSQAWCVDLTPPPPKKASCKKAKGKPEAPTMLQSIQQLVQGMAAGGGKPILMIGPGIANNIPPEALEALKAQGAQILQPGMVVPGLPPQPPMKLPPPQLGPDHEDPLARLPATVRYAWQNWAEKKPLPEEEILNFQLPKLPAAHAAKNKPPHLAVGTNDSKMFNGMQEWLFALAVDVKPESKLAIHAMVFWDNLLIVVSSAAKEARHALTKDIAEAVIGMKRLKPDIYMMTRRDYLVLVSNKAEESAKKKKP